MNYKNATDFIEDITKIFDNYGFKQKEIPTKLLGRKDSEAKMEYPEDKFLLESALIAKNLCNADYPERQVYTIKFDGKDFYIHTFAIGTTDPYAEAALLSVCHKAKSNADPTNQSEFILNTLGEKDNFKKYLDELYYFLRKRKKYLPSPILKILNPDNTKKIIQKLRAQNNNILEDAPTILDFLNEDAKTHFYTLTDYLDKMRVPYNIDPFFFANDNLAKHSIFNREEAKSHIFGARLDNLAEKLGINSLVSLIIKIPKFGRKTKINTEKNKRTSKNKFFLAHISSLAKSQALDIMDKMKKNKLAVEQSMVSMSLLEQYALAQRMGAKYIIIIGHKEAVEQSAIVRNIDTRQEETIPQQDLIKYLKSLK